MGDECTSLTGGWSNARNTAGKGTNYLYTTGGSAGQNGTMGTANVITGVSDYNSLVSFYTRTTNKNAYRVGFGATKPNVDFLIRSTETGTKALLIRTFANMTGTVSDGYAMVDSDDNNLTVYTYCVALAKEDDLTGLSDYGLTIATILTNSASLLADEDAVNYMISECTGEFMWNALNNSTFMTAYASSTYKSLIDDNECWSKALALKNIS